MSYKRLRAIVDLIDKNENILDVGTDHCLVPIFLLKKNHEGLIDASDINELPLNIAKKNLENEKFLHKVNLFISNGLEKIDINKYTTIIISGMGGKNIKNIIINSNYKNKYILNPTNSLEEVRLALFEKKFEIINEIVVFERKKFNVIIVAKKSKNKFYSKMEFKFGPILMKTNDEIVFKYYKYLYNLYEKNAFLSKNNLYKKEERIWLKNKILSKN